MSFAIQVKNMGEFVLLRCVGRLVFGEGVNVLRAAIQAQTSKAMLLDFTDVDVIDAAGVGALLSAHQHAHSSEQTLVIVEPNQRVCEVLRITRVDSILNVRMPGKDFGTHVAPRFLPRYQRHSSEV